MAPIVAALVNLAPMLARHLGAGEASTAVIDQAVAIARQVTGESDPAAAVAKLQADPAATLTYQQRLAELDADLERAYLADRAGARSRDVELAKAGRLNVRADVMLALAFVSVIAIAAVLALGGLDPGEAIAGFLMTIGGMFARNIGTAFDFEFGSSRGSREKDEALRWARREQS